MQQTLDVMRTSDGYDHRNAYRRQVESFQVTRVKFKGHHAMMFDNDIDYSLIVPQTLSYEFRLGGNHWVLNEPSIPISQTRKTRLVLEVELSYLPVDCDSEGLTAFVLAMPPKTPADVSPFFVFQLETDWLLGWERGSCVVYLEGLHVLPDDITSVYDYLDWTIEIAGRTYKAGETGPHQVFVTYGEPRIALDPHGLLPPQEMGVTHHRMRAAVTAMQELLREFSPPVDGLTRAPVEWLDVHRLAHCLVSSVQGYTLEDSRVVPSAYKHSGYYNSIGGAWPVYEWRQALAQCQAVIRYARGVLCQLGVPGEISFVVVYAHASVDEGRAALEDSVEPSDGDPSKLGVAPDGVLKVYGGLTRKWQSSRNDDDEWLALADAPVKVGDVIVKGVLNSYEACLKVSWKGSTRYYPAGVMDRASRDPPYLSKVYTSAQDVLNVFHSLVWVKWAATKGGHRDSGDCMRLSRYWRALGFAGLLLSTTGCGAAANYQEIMRNSRMYNNAVWALQLERAEMIEVTGGDLERVRQYLLASDASTEEVYRYQVDSDHFKTSPAAALVAGLWASPSLHCALRRLDLSESTGFYFGSRWDDTMMCWWSDNDIEVRDVGFGRIVSVPIEDDYEHADLQRRLFGRVVPLFPAPDDQWLLSTQPTGRLPPMWDPAIVGFGTWGRVRFLQFWWMRGGIQPGKPAGLDCPTQWFPEELVEIWERVSQSSGSEAK